VSKTRDEARAVERDVTALIARFFVCLDAHDGAAAATLLASDIEWITQRHGTERGAAAAVASIAGRPKGSVSRHCVANPVVDAIADDEARAEATVVIWAIDGGDTPARMPVRMGLPRAILAFHFRVIWAADSWRIARLSSDLVFAAG